MNKKAIFIFSLLLVSSISAEPYLDAYQESASGIGISATCSESCQNLGYTTGTCEYLTGGCLATPANSCSWFMTCCCSGLPVTTTTSTTSTTTTLNPYCVEFGDVGIDEYTYGYLEYFSPPDTYATHYDACRNETHLFEKYCLSETTPSLVMITCSYMCEDGACITTTTSTTTTAPTTSTLISTTSTISIITSTIASTTTTAIPTTTTTIFIPQIVVTRTLPSKEERGDTVNVTLDVVITNDTSATSAIIREYVPTGWTIVYSTPTYNVFNSSSGEIKWVLYQTSFISQQITYTATIPEEETCGNATFSGDVLYRHLNVDHTENFLGDSEIVITTIPHINRVLPPLVNFDSTFTGTLELIIEDDECTPSAVIITEYLPLTWTLTSSSPTYSSFNAETGEIKWVLYGGSLGSQNITYTVSTPVDGIDGTVTFSGQVSYNDASGIFRTDDIGGTTDLDIYTKSDTVTINRELPSSASMGNTITVSLVLDVNETQSLDAVIIKDYVPSGWNVTSSNPSAELFDFDSGEIKWILYSNDLVDRTITYNVEIPETESEGERTFVGEIAYLEQEELIRVAIMGDDEITIASVIGDTNGDGEISDFELLTLISQWTDGEVDDFDLLEAIDNWANS